jgi:hypothetical protein
MRKAIVIYGVVCVATFIAGMAARYGFAADANGYTALYECRAGNPRCNINVSSFVTHGCDTKYSTDGAGGTTSLAGSWSTVNWSEQYICFIPDDYTSLGTLTVPASGSSGAYKVISCRNGDGSACAAPWLTAAANTARFGRIVYTNRSYLIFWHLASTGTATLDKIYCASGCSHIVIDSNLVEGVGNSGSGDNANIGVYGSPTDISIQHNVSRNCQITNGATQRAVHVAQGTNIFVVNNQLYDCAKGFANSFNGINSNFVVENNDVWLSNTGNYRFTDCSGNYTTTGDCSIGKGGTGPESGGSSGDPVKFIHNRVWNWKPCDTTLSCSGGGSAGPAMGGGNHVGASGAPYVLFQNNIVMHGCQGIVGINTVGGDNSNSSVIGNIIWDFKQLSSADCGAIYTVAVMDAWEIYTNTIIDSSIPWAKLYNRTNFDLRCNAIINSAAATGTGGSGTQFDYNDYIKATDTGETHKFSVSYVTRADSTLYSFGQLIERCAALADGSQCDYLYEVTQAGTSAGTAPAYCTSPGCTTTDGTMIVTAIMEPLAQFRKLLDASPELFYVPRARFWTGYTAARICPIQGETDATGSRNGVGIDNTVLGAGGFMDQDLTGAIGE